MMMTSMPTGDGTVTDAPAQSAVDEEAAPASGLEPDTAIDAAGETDAGSTTEVDPDIRPGNGSAEPDGTGQPATEPESHGVPGEGSPADRTVLDGPALENPEMHRATDDLRSSQDKTADAREIADKLAAATQPGDA
jgi:hypothetical protein